jgi:hypothetical protein
LNAIAHRSGIASPQGRPHFGIMRNGASSQNAARFIDAPARVNPINASDKSG